MRQVDQELFDAIIQNSKEGIEKALKAGADINATHKRGKTALHTAARKGNVEALKVLLERVADINVKDKAVKTALHYATKNGHVEALELLLENGANIEAEDFHHQKVLHDAAMHGQVEALKVLLEKGAEIEAKDYWKRTPLHFAASNGHVEALRVFLEKGAEIEAKDDDNKTVLHYAASSGHAEALKVLASYGAEIDEQVKKLIAEKCPENTLQELEKISLNYRKKLVHQSASNLYKQIFPLSQKKGLNKDVMSVISRFVNKDNALDNKTAERIVELAFNHSRRNESKESFKEIINSNEQTKHNEIHLSTLKNINVFESKKEEISQVKEVELAKTLLMSEIKSSIVENDIKEKAKEVELAFNHSRRNESKESFKEIINSNEQTKHNEIHLSTLKNINVFESKKEEISQVKEVELAKTIKIEQTEIPKKDTDSISFSKTEGYYKIATALIVTFANTISRAISSSSSGKGFINFVSPFTKRLGTIADSVMSKLPIASGTQKLAKDLVKSSAPLIIGIAAIKAVDSFIRNRKDNQTIYRSLFNAFGAFASMIVQGEVAAVGATVATVIGGATIGAGVTVTGLSFVAAAVSVYAVSRVGHEAKKAVGPLSERILNAYNNRTQTQTAI